VQFILFKDSQGLGAQQLKWVDSALRDLAHARARRRAGLRAARQITER
jgi:hypothetical protein